MKLLAEITEATLRIGTPEILGDQYELRKSARGLLLNEAGAIAVQYLAKYDYHKLPGGGVDPGETIEAALRREIMEEVGCAITDITPLGLVIEYRNKYNLLHLSYGFAMQVAGELNPTALEPAEVAEGMETHWLQPAEALQKMQAAKPDRYEGAFQLAREIAIVEAYLERT